MAAHLVKLLGTMHPGAGDVSVLVMAVRTCLGTIPAGSDTAPPPPVVGIVLVIVRSRWSVNDVRYPAPPGAKTRPDRWRGS